MAVFEVSNPRNFSDRTILLLTKMKTKLSYPISIAALFASASLWATDFTVNSNITDSASSVLVGDGDTAALSGSFTIGGTDASLVIDGTAAVTPPTATIADNTTVTVTDGGSFDTIDGTLTFSGNANGNTGTINVNGALGTAGTVTFKDSTVLYAMTTAGRHINLNASGYGSFVIDNTAFYQTEGSWNSIRINLSDNGSLVLKNGSIMDMSQNGGYATPNRGNPTITLSGNSSMSIESGSVYNLYSYTNDGAPHEANPSYRFSENAQLSIDGVGSRFNIQGSHGSSNYKYLTLSDNAEINVTNGANFSSGNTVFALNMSGSSSLNLSGASTFTRDGGSSNINASENAKINVYDTSSIATNVGMNLSDNAQFNLFGVTGALSTNIALTGSASINVKSDSASNVSVVTAGAMTIAESTSVNVEAGSSLALGATTIGGTAAKLTAIGTDATIIMPNNNVLTVNEGGSATVADGAVLSLMNNATINVSGANAATAGIFEIKDASVTKTETGYKRLNGSGYGQFVFDNAQLDWGQRVAITLADNSKMILKNGTVWADTNDRSFPVSISGNAEFRVESGSSFKFRNYNNTDNIYAMTGGKTVVTGTGSIFHIDNNNAASAVAQFNLSGNSIFRVENNATLNHANTASFNLSGNAQFNVNNASYTVTNNHGSVNTINLTENASATFSGISNITLNTINVGTADTDNATLRIEGSKIVTTRQHAVNGTLNVWGAAGTTAAVKLGGGIEFIADNRGISTLNVTNVGLFDGVLIIDFSNFIGDNVIGQTYEFDIISASADWSAIAADFLGDQDSHGDRVNVIALDGIDEWAITYVGNTLKLSYTMNIPEPSTYAAIFGALALALAAYRRRK